MNLKSLSEGCMSERSLDWMLLHLALASSGAIFGRSLNDGLVKGYFLSSICISGGRGPGIAVLYKRC
jgi:hypothetical protein